MDMITAEEVVLRIELYFIGGALESLTPQQAPVVRSVMSA